MHEKLAAERLAREGMDERKTTDRWEPAASRIAASPAASRTLYLSHLSSSTCCPSHSLSLALFSFSVEPPPTTTTARSLSSYSPLRHSLYRNKHCLSIFVSHSPSPAAPRALCISSHFLSKICLNLGAFLQGLARCYLCSTHAVAANKDLCANSQFRWQYCWGFPQQDWFYSNKRLIHIHVHQTLILLLEEEIIYHMKDKNYMYRHSKRTESKQLL